MVFRPKPAGEARPDAGTRRRRSAWGVWAIGCNADAVFCVIFGEAVGMMSLRDGCRGGWSMEHDVFSANRQCIAGRTIEVCMKRAGVAVVFFVVALSAFPAASRGASGLISTSEAARFGLTRAWFQQAEVDSSRGKAQSLILDEGVLFVQTDQGKIDAINANTGERLWVTQVGEPGRITTQPAISHKYVAAVNGSTVYVLNRVTGKILWSASLPGAAGAGPCLSQQRVFIPLVNGRVLGYRLTPAVDPTADLKKRPEAGDAQSGGQNRPAPVAALAARQDAAD